MKRLIAERLGMSVALLFVVSVITYVLQAMIPGNAAQQILAARGQRASGAPLRQLEAQFGLNRPLYDQYWHWLVHAVQGNLGISYTTSQPVVSVLNAALPITLCLTVGSTLVAALLGMGLGVLSAVRGHLASKLLDGVSVLGMAVPNYWLALVLVVLFATTIRLFPAIGYVSIGTSPLGWARSLVLPVAALTFGSVTLIARQTRDQMLEVLSRPFILSLRANGVSELSVIFRHALRNAAIPIVTVISLTFVGTLGSTVFIESVFVLPGLGSALVNATNQHDIPMVQGISMYFILIVVVVNFVTDLAYAWLNPKVRRAA
jgi:peptide/nickel transport system permease protein